MFRSLLRYIRDEIRPRWRSIASAPALWLAVVVGIVLALGMGRSEFSDVRVVDVAVAILAYSAIAFGFCLAGMTIALTLPSLEFARDLAKKPEGLDRDAFSDLLFVFSWTAVVHWLAMVSAVALLPVLGSDSGLLTTDADLARRLLVGTAATLLIYGLIQFLVTLITLAQVARVYVQFLQRDDTKRP